ncbi:short chain dehydrogenase reductase [Poronia punctata]|nr:short chain dehydrogenase reductase [Poronia punctata]
MASLIIRESDIESQMGKTAIITGGASGLGLATAKILAGKGAQVHVLDVAAPKEDGLGPLIKFHRCDVTSWEDLRSNFESVGNDVDYVFANAGIMGQSDYISDRLDSEGRLLEPDYSVVDINLRGAFNTVKLAWSSMRRRNEVKGRKPGSIVITASAAAYAPEMTLPIYSATKAASSNQLVGLIRALRPVIIRDNITINGVAPGATNTNMVPAETAETFGLRGIPLSDPEHVGLALVYSAVAKQDRRVETYGIDGREELWGTEHWNGRVILTLGDTYTELEEPTADLRPFWFGRENDRSTRLQQSSLDTRSG